MAQVIERLCKDCRYFVEAETDPERGFWGSLFAGLEHPAGQYLRHISGRYDDRCSWRTDVVTGESTLTPASNERHVGHCGEDGTHFEPTTTQQGEP